MSALEKFEHIVAWYADHVGGQVDQLAPQADPTRIAEIELLLGEPLPSDLRALLERYDGEDRAGADGVFLGHEPICIDKIIDSLEFSDEIADDEDFAESTDAVFPDGTVKRKYFRIKWLLLIGDYGGNFIGIDLTPARSAKKGRISCSDVTSSTFTWSPILGSNSSIA